MVLTAQDGHPLLRLETHPGVYAAPRRATLWLYHFAILLPDRAALGRFVAHLAALGVAAGMSDHLVSEAIYLTDPDGLGIEVYADRPRSQWRYRGPQLVMATEPLATRDLVAVAAVPWSGMPAGTTMGHLHLHVGDLAAAEAFYHAALGFDKVVWEYPGALFLSAGGYHHPPWHKYLVARPAARARPGPPAVLGPHVPGEGHAAAAARSLQSAGYHPEPIADGWVIRDPWGTALHIVRGER